MVIEKLTQGDKPAIFRWDTPWRPREIEELQASLGLRPGQTRDINTVMGYVLAQAIVTYRANPERWISYSRRAAWYAEPRRQQYFPVRNAYAGMKSAVDQLAFVGLIDHDKAAPGDMGHQSSFRGNAALWHAYNENPTPLICSPRERIILRDASGAPAPYKNSRDTDRWRKQVHKFNEALTDTRIEYDGKIIREGDPVWVKDSDSDDWEPRMIWGTATLSLHRIWNENWRRNGRLYGCWVQNVPKESRRALLLDGEPIAEPDYPALHCQLLYDRAGKLIPNAPFDIEGWSRSEAKTAFYTMLNARDTDSARRAITGHLRRSGAGDLMQGVMAKHSGVSDHLCSGMGANLMFTDSKIMCRNLIDLNRAGILALPIHDSVIVQAKNGSKAMEIMERNLTMELDHSAPQKSASHVVETTKENIEPLPHNGQGGRPGVVVAPAVPAWVAWLPPEQASLAVLAWHYGSIVELDRAA
jgi:hypothetical protein